MKICDLHNDLLTCKRFTDIYLSYRDGKTELDACKKFLKQVFSQYLTWGVDSVVLAVWTTHTPFQNFELIEDLYNFAFQCAGNLKILPAIEDISYLTLDDIYRLKDLSTLYATLTWNHQNKLGGGALSDGRLTPEGIKVVKALSEAGIVLDTAHLNRATFYDICEIGDARLINSHTAFYEVMPHPRNINKQQIQIITERGGLIGLAFVGDFLCQSGIAEIDDLIRHIDWFVQKFGYKNLALGTDFWGSDNLIQGLKNYDKAGLLVENLIKIGYNKECVESIFFKNFNNYMRYGNVRHL